MALLTVVLASRLQLRSLHTLSSSGSSSSFPLATTLAPCLNPGSRASFSSLAWRAPTPARAWQSLVVPEPVTSSLARFSSASRLISSSETRGILSVHAGPRLLRKKGGGRSGGRNRDDEAEKSSESNEAELEGLVTEARDGMRKAIEFLETGLSGLRTKASPALLDAVRVRMAGSTTPVPLAKVALVTQKDASSIRVAVFDPTHIRLVEKAIIDTPDLGLTPMIDGNQIHVPVPKPTAELRQSLTRKAGEKAEQARTTLRSSRTKALAGLKKHSKDMSKEVQRLWDAKVQAVLDEHNKQITTMLKAKEKELEQ